MGDTLNSMFCMLIICLLLAQTVLQADSSNIAFFFGFSLYSHRIPAWPLATGLAERGHNVTFISPFPAKSPHPKVHDLSPQKLIEWSDSWKEHDHLFVQRKANDLIYQWIQLIHDGLDMCELVYSDKEFLNWVETAELDLIFIDSLFNECGYGLAHKFGAKIIHFAASTACSWNAESFGNPDTTNWISDFAFPFDPTTVTFKERLINALIPVAWDLYRRWVYFPKLEELTHEKLGIKDFPKFEEIERNTSLVFLNTHYGEEFARPLPPNMVSIGGIAYVEKRTTLPKDLATFLEKGNGFIYVSFGSYAEFQRMDASTQQIFIRAMQSFPDMQFVLKLGNSSLVKGFPNAFIRNWLPQQALLAHPKIKAFITHAGLNSVQESIVNAVPLISFPIFGDQDYIAERIHRKEYGVRLEISTVTQTELENAIAKVLTDSKYRENMKKVSRIFKDRPETPLNTALWWTNYVLTHSSDDLEALRPLSIRQSWWVRRQLDVWITIVGIAAFIFIATLFILLKILKYLYCVSTTAKLIEIRGDKKKKV